MSNETDKQRIKQLEEKAVRSYIANSDWADVIMMLDEDERDEYYILMTY